MALEGRQHFGMAMEAAEEVLGIRFVLERALAVKLIEKSRIEHKLMFQPFKYP